MTDRLRILQVNTSDARGGAHRVGYELHRSFREAGHDSWLAVGSRRTADPRVVEITNESARPRWTRFWSRTAAAIEASGGGASSRLLGRALRTIAEPRRWASWRLGHEDFSFPGTWSLLDLLPEPVDIVHCHNLHGGYFDLRALAEMSRRRPVVLSLHDAWLLSGHCAHSFDCNRWEIGCGSCPDLEIYPPVKRDATARNWKLKRQIFAASSVFVATPCEWLMARAQRSLLADAIVEARVIPYGIDSAVFHLGSKATARATLELPHTARVLLFSATGARTSRWRDFDALREAVALTAETMTGEYIILVVLGDDGPDERAGRAHIRYIPYLEGAELALYYQAADLYLHPALADTFPNSVLEALACGTPVVASAVGGIPEQVGEQTGALVPAGDARRMADATAAFLRDPGRLAHASEVAARDAAERFGLRRQAVAYLDWYAEILDTRDPAGRRPRRNALARVP